MKRKIIILSIMLCLALSGVIYANWNDSLQIDSRFTTGALDLERIENIQISLTGHDGYYSYNRTDIESLIGIQQQYEGLQISYTLMPSLRNTIDNLDVMAEDILMEADNAPNLKWIYRSSHINHMGDNIDITHTFTLSNESIIDISNYIYSVKNDLEKYQVSSIDRWDIAQEKLDQKKLASFVNGQEESSAGLEDIDTARFTEQFLQEYMLASKEVNYSFDFHAVVKQAPQAISSNLFTYGLWTDEVSFEGSLCITYPELMKNTEYISVEDFEDLYLQKDPDETIEKAQIAELDENNKIIVEASQEDNIESILSISRASELDVEDNSVNEVDEVNIEDNSVNEADEVNIEESSVNEVDEVNIEDRSVNEVDEVNIEDNSIDEVGEFNTDDSGLDEAVESDINEIAGEETVEG